MIRTPLLALVVCSLAGCAPQVFRADAGAMFVRPRGDVALQNSAGNLVLGNNQNDIDSGMQLGETEGTPFVRLQGDWEGHRVRAHGFGLDQDGNGALQGDFGNIPVGTPVSTSLEYVSIALNWSYDLIPDTTFRLAPGLQAGFYSMNVAARSIAPAATEKVSTAVIVPQAYVEGEVDLGLLAFTGSFAVMSADLRDANGRYLDAEAAVALRPDRDFEILAGWRYIVQDAHGVATSRDFDADVYLNGWFIGGGVRF